MDSILSFVVGAVMAIGSFFGFTEVSEPVQEPVLGAAFNPTGGGTYRLQTSLGSTDTSIRLSSFKEPVSNINYTMSYLNTDIGYGTLDPQTNRSEFVSFTGITQNSDGTATLTGVTRGLSRSYPYTASTTLRQAHPGQSIFILSDSPQLFNEYAVKRNNENITGSWTTVTPTGSAGIATKGYVDGVVSGGSVTTDTLVLGATAGETFATGTVVYQLTADSEWYLADADVITSITDTFIGIAQGAGTNGVAIPGGVLVRGVDETQVGMTPGANIFVSSTAGATSTATSSRPLGKARTATQLYVDPYFVRPNNLNANATNPLSINTVSYVFPSTQGASSTALLNNGSGTFSWGAFSSTIMASSSPLVINPSVASSTVFSATIPANTLGTDGVIRVPFPVQYSVVNGSQFYIEFGYGGSTTTMSYSNSAGSTQNRTAMLEYIIKANGATNAQRSTVSALVNTGAANEALDSAVTGTTRLRTLTVDSTQDQLLLISIKTGNASDVATTTYGFIEVLKR